MTGSFGRYFSFGSYPERLSKYYPFLFDWQKAEFKDISLISMQMRSIRKVLWPLAQHSGGTQMRREGNTHLVRLQLPKKELVGNPEISPIRSNSLS